MASNQPLTFTAEQANSTIKLTNTGAPPTVNLQYSTDGGSTWATFQTETTYTLANIGDTIQIRATTTNASGMGQDISNYHQFSMSGKIAASGNIMSLYDKEATTRTMTAAGFYRLFAYCSSLTTAPELPATTMKISCYREMFLYCYSLTTAPELPATTMADDCYMGMFNSCSSLTTAPSILPATTLASYCYSGMFRGCSLLATPPELPATTMKNACYQNMFYECTSLTTAPELPATTLATYCYNYMFKRCTSLTTAPELPATTMKISCYSEMFSGCSSLNSVTAAISSEDLATGSDTFEWLSGVASEGTFTTLDEDFDSQITRSGNTVPVGWIIASPAPEQNELFFGGNRVKTLAINGKNVKTLFLNGKQVVYA